VRRSTAGHRRHGHDDDPTGVSNKELRTDFVDRAAEFRAATGGVVSATSYPVRFDARQPPTPRAAVVVKFEVLVPSPLACRSLVRKRRILHFDQLTQPFGGEPASAVLPCGARAVELVPEGRQVFEARVQGGDADGQRRHA
jgi:hypothetical protein